MKERGILFSRPMVRAIFDDRKTKTRRVMQPQPIEESGTIRWGSPRYDNGDGAKYFHTRTVSPSIMRLWVAACPYGVPGDRLWVRETWYPSFKRTATNNGVSYPSTAEGGAPYGDPGESNPGWSPHGGWKPSIFMPRWASRLTLEITDIRVERLQEISAKDAKAEGAFLGRCGCATMQERARTPLETTFRQTYCHIHGEEFHHLWDSINAKRGFGWDVNPWVWGLTFRRVER